MAHESRDVSARRRTPVQARSRASYERILDATVAILEEQGWDGLSTNAVADRAGVTVPTVYSYFPDKYAIVHELFERYEHDRRVALGPALRAAVERGDWEATLRITFVEAAELRTRYRGGMALRHAMSAVPELRRCQEESSARAVGAFSGLLRGCAPEVSREQADLAAELIVHGARPVVHLAQQGHGLDEDLLEEAVRMTLLYVGDVVERAARAAGEPVEAQAGEEADTAIGA